MTQNPSTPKKRKTELLILKDGLSLVFNN